MKEQSYHINILELIAVKLTNKAFTRFKRNFIYVHR